MDGGLRILEIDDTQSTIHDLDRPDRGIVSAQSQLHDSQSLCRGPVSQSEPLQRAILNEQRAYLGAVGHAGRPAVGDSAELQSILGARGPTSGTAPINQTLEIYRLFRQSKL